MSPRVQPLLPTPSTSGSNPPTPSHPKEVIPRSPRGHVFRSMLLISPSGRIEPSEAQSPSDNRREGKHHGLCNFQRHNQRNQARYPTVVPQPHHPIYELDFGHLVRSPSLPQRD